MQVDRQADLSLYVQRADCSAYVNCYGRILEKKEPTSTRGIKLGKVLGIMVCSDRQAKIRLDSLSSNHAYRTNCNSTLKARSSATVCFLLLMTNDTSVLSSG